MLLTDDNPAPDFSDPLGLLAACHRRMLDLCELLDRLPHWIEANGVDREVEDSVTRIKRYFETAAPLHHQDEEQDLFPMLIHDVAARALIGQLQQEHRQLDRLWQDLAAQLQALAQGEYDAPAFDAAAIPFCHAYRTHVQQEDSQLLKIAQAQLSTSQLQQLGDAMARRRHS